jgi:hypothetical protein
VCAATHEAVLERLNKRGRKGEAQQTPTGEEETMVSNKNQGPLKDAVGRKTRKHTVEEELRIAEAVIERLGPPGNPQKRGRKPQLQPKKASLKQSSRKRQKA